MKSKLTFLISCLLVFFSLQSFSQKSNQTGKKRVIVGTVTNSENQPLEAATVLIKGSNTGTATDNNGNYEISISEEVTLIFSMIGYSAQEIPTEGKSRIDMQLLEEGVGMDEVVLVGYSEVEKKHVASSVAQMDMEKARYRPIFKMQEAFSGTIPGVTRLQGSNLPGSTGGQISIRGISTLQNADPLVIVDGIEQSLTDLDPNQIKSVTVLKDAASASMYGSRGANGVIIVETERGYTGKFKVDINTWAAFDKAIDLPDFVGIVDYMKLNNEAKEIQGQTKSYTDEDIRMAESGEIKGVNWMDKVMRKTPFSYNTTASISGGGGVGSFNLMLGHIKESGLNDVEGTEKFSARFNTNVNIADKFVLLADFYAHRLQVNRLYANDDGHGLYKIAWRMNPTQQVFYDSDLKNHYILHNNYNPIASILHGGTKNYLHDRSTINLRPKYNINKKLSLEGNVSYMLNKSADKYKRETFRFYDGDGAPVTIWGNAVGASQGVSQSQVTARALVNYVDKLRGDKDKIYLTAGTEAMNYTYTDYREISKSSFFGKLNYSLDNRYLLEVTARGDGSSKFAPGHKWGFFPSGALAWNVHNEKFLQQLRRDGVISNLKVRLSYGLIGNENVDPYLWQEDVNNWGWTMRVPNPEFSWEKQKQFNAGMDVSLLDKRLNFTFDVYNKFSYDLIFSSFPVPPLTGSHTLESSVNIGEVENKGWEFSANWNDNIGDFQYRIGGMVFNNKNRVLKAGYNKSDTLIFKGNNDKIWYKGVAVDNYYGFETNGYYQSQKEVDDATAKFPHTFPGDIRYVDQNNDGVLNDEDRVYLGDPYPHYNYAVNLDLGYKNWDFSLLGQGVGERLGWIKGQEGYPVYVDGSSNSLGAPRKYYAENRWTPETPNSRFPRVWTGNSSNTYLSDIWLGNAAFFRVKMLQLGYTFPEVGKSFRNIRVYINAQDAITFTNWEGLDPERDGGNGYYPRMATYSVGVRATIL